MAYSSEQQGRIDAANAKVASAQKNRDIALANYKARYSNFCNDGWWSYLSDCDIRNVTSKWRKKHIEALTVGIALFTNNYFNKKWSKPNSCEEALEKGIILSWECQRGTGDCRRSDTCDSKVSEYNAKLYSLNESATAEANARAIVENAQADLKKLLDTIASEVQNDPAFINEQSSIEASIQKNKQKLFFIFAVVVIIIFGAIAWKRSSNA